MTNLELVLNMLAEASTTEISQKEEPETFEHSKQIAHRGGKVAGAARKELEAQTGQKVVSPLNAKRLSRNNIVLLWNCNLSKVRFTRYGASG